MAAVDRTYQARQSGYSGTPLEKKLGLKAGQRVAFIALPDELDWLAKTEDFASVNRVSDWADYSGWTDPLDVLHGFAVVKADLEENIGIARRNIVEDGMIWISWPKRASKVATDITEDVVREIALPTGLVDVKVCAVDEIWSGLKLVIRKELRTRAGRVR